MLLVRNSVPVLETVPSVLDLDNVQKLFVIMKRGYVCSGLTHVDFPRLADSCQSEGKIVLKGLNKAMVGFSHCRAFRHTMCEVIIENLGVPGCNLCANCAKPKFRQSLRSRESYLRSHPQDNVSKVQANSRTPFSLLSATEKDVRMKRMSRAKHRLQDKLHRLQTKIEKMVTEESVDVTPEQNSVLTKLAQDGQPDVLRCWPQNSPQRLLWEQQLKHSKVKGPSGMRWHPTMIRWCLSMFLKSPAAYKQLASSGFLHLPSQSLLKSYTNFTDNLPGVNPEILKILIKEFNIPNAQPFPNERVLGLG